MNISKKIKTGNNINYQILMEEEIASLKDRKPGLLLHSCCAPCSSSVLERIGDFFELTVLYYNPNIYPFEEYEKRLNEQKKLLSLIGNIRFTEAEYVHEEFLKASEGYENEAEGGNRCRKCFELRLEKTAKYAVNNGFEYFTTTLSVSPYKDACVLNGILSNLAEKYCLKPLLADFKKKNGYARSAELSELYGIYRQNYCGCEFSHRT